MWSSDRRKFLVLLAAGSLAACGFSPAMAPGGSGHKLWEQVEVAAPYNADTFDLVAYLEQRLGRSKGARYKLNWQVNTSLVEVANRDLLRGTLTYSLVELSTGKTVTSGDVENFAVGTDTGDILASVSSQQDGRRRLMVMLADQLVARLMAARLP